MCVSKKVNHDPLLDVTSDDLQTWSIDAGIWGVVFFRTDDVTGQRSQVMKTKNTITSMSKCPRVITKP